MTLHVGRGASVGWIDRGSTANTEAGGPKSLEFIIDGLLVAFDSEDDAEKMAEAILARLGRLAT